LKTAEGIGKTNYPNLKININLKYVMMILTSEYFP